MDPIAHSLVGGMLAETGLRDRTRLATLTLVVGANLPDLDGLSYFISGDLALEVRRGWTHGVLAMAVLPVLLAASMYGLGRLLPSGDPSARPSLRALAALSYLSVLTHPALDWLNAYGVRLLMPFDGRWFYGDSLFIVDPWFWLMAGTAVATAHLRTWRGRIGCVAVAALLTLVVLTQGMVPRSGRVVWIVALIALALGHAAGALRHTRRVAVAMAAALSIYVASMAVATHRADARARVFLAARGIEVSDIAALPVAANPFVRDVIAVAADRYVFVRIDWLAADVASFSDAPIARTAPDPIVAAALASPQVAGLRGWLRYPAFESRTIRNGYRVLIKDVRFSRMRNAGIGYEEVDLNLDLTPKYPRGERTSQD